MSKINIVGVICPDRWLGGVPLVYGCGLVCGMWYVVCGVTCGVWCDVRCGVCAQCSARWWATAVSSHLAAGDAPRCALAAPAPPPPPLAAAAAVCHAPTDATIYRRGGRRAVLAACPSKPRRRRRRPRRRPRPRPRRRRPCEAGRCVDDATVSCLSLSREPAQWPR